MTQRAAHEALYLAKMKRAGKVETVAERNKRNSTKAHARRYGKDASADVRSPDIGSLDISAAQPGPERKTAALVPARQSRIASPAILLPKAGIAP